MSRALGLAGAALALAASLASAQEPAPSSDPAGVLGPPRGRPLAGEALAARTADVASLLRCPVCQGLSVADSPATMAVNMKREVRELLAKGYDQDQVLAYFEHSYGEFVRLQPPLRGVNWLVWALPLLALATGAFFVTRALGGRRGPATAALAAGEPVPGRGTLPEDPKLARHVRRVRELAYGWPGGEPPSGTS